MATIPGFLLRHTAVVEALTGEGPYGPTYAAPETLRCFVDDKRRLVRGNDGSQIVSETTLYMRLTETCPAGSRVTVAGRTTTVITSSRRDGGGLPTPDHLEVVLQ